ncbi:unnamed protein product [Moneuplotes crassus]|uniref:Uncharacterized protein n=1 Tax=Euplotes crassus TaxID=5936 RepID=A0AAD1U7L0_EUPCR|nr:unnamed protein product [Moneuplotes crassus]
MIPLKEKVVKLLLTKKKYSTSCEQKLEEHLPSNCWQLVTEKWKSLETILVHLSKTQIKVAQEASDSFNNKTEYVSRLSEFKKKIRSMGVSLFY